MHKTLLFNSFSFVSLPGLSNNAPSPTNYVVPNSATILATQLCSLDTITVVDDNIFEPAGHQFTVSLVAVTLGTATINTNFDTFDVSITDNDGGY